MELKTTLFDVAGGIATITLNRPHRLNAWTGRMHTEYRHLLARVEDDPAVRAVVVTGAGRGFCAGADSQALEGHIEKGRYDPGTGDDIAKPGYGVQPQFDATFAYHFGLTKPVIAAINGPVAGVGLVLACFADLRFAAEGVKLTTAHGRLGLPAEYGLSWLLPRLIGLAKANDLLLSSRVFMSEEAMEMGLLNGLHPAGELLPRVYEYARELVDHVAPTSLAATKRQIYADLHRDVASAVDDSERRLEAMTGSADFREGVKALAEKRRPEFRR